jgi:hypothetical protein
VAAAALLIALLFWLLIVAAGAGLYFLPTIIAVAQHRSNVAAVAVINVLLGWSFVGWIVALVMALSRDAEPMQVVHVHQQIGYVPTEYQEPPPPYPQVRYAPGSQIQPVDAPPAPGSQLSSIQQPNQREF